MKRRVGETATTKVPLTSDDGLRWVEIYTSVNAKTDSAVAARAIEGQLHELEGEGPLAQPYVFHDPDREVFALVVPEVMRHRLFLERAHFLESLHESGDALLPYMLEGQAVVGSAGLLTLIQSGERGAAANAQLSGAQEALRRGQSELLSQQTAMAATHEEFNALRRDLELREQELDARFERLREREQARLAHVPAADDEPSAEEPTRVVDSALLRRAVEEVDDDEFDEVDLGSVEDLEDADALPDAAVEDAVLDEALVDDVEEVDEQPNAEEAVADVIQLDLVEPIDDASLKAVLMDEEEEDEEELEGAIPAPQSLLADPLAQMVAEELEAGPYLFARLQEGDDAAEFSEAAELLVQYVVVDERPVVLLALTDFSGERPYPRRAALDPREEADMEFLKKLCADEEVSVALYSPSGRYRYEYKTKLGERCANLSTILERVPQATGTLDASTALERALAAAPPVHMKGHPFVVRESASSPKDAARELMLLAKWAKPEKSDLALLALSIPEARIAASFERVLSDAFRYGLALPGELAERAVALGVAADPGALVQRSIANFRKTARAGSGLSTVEVGKNWEALLDVANQLELAVDPEAHEQAQRDIARGRGDSVRPPPAVSGDPSTLDDVALLAIADHPRRRLAVAEELVKRGGDEHLKAVAASMRKMVRGDLLSIVVAMVASGESSMDALIDGLDAKKSFVRQGCALGLGELGQRRGVGPLVSLLQAEKTESWREVAWLLGRFGSSTLRPLERAVKNPKGPEERIHTAMAHLLEEDDKALSGFSVKEAVAAAEALRGSVRSYRAKRETEEKPSVPAGFSRAFFRSLKVATE
ncbi:MAG: hypothetical protein AB8H86_02110 [Polyangiales bacterium]